MATAPTNSATLHARTPRLSLTHGGQWTSERAKRSVESSSTTDTMIACRAVSVMIYCVTLVLSIAKRIAKRK